MACNKSNFRAEARYYLDIINSAFKGGVDKRFGICRILVLKPFIWAKALNKFGNCVPRLKRRGYNIP